MFWIYWRLWSLRMMEMVVTTGAIICANLQSDRHHQQTNTQLLYRPDALPVAQPAVSKHWREDFITYLLLLIVEESGVSPCCGGTNSSPVDSMWSGRQCINSDYSTHGIFATGKITAVLFIPSFFHLMFGCGFDSLLVLWSCSNYSASYMWCMCWRRRRWCRWWWWWWCLLVLMNAKRKKNKKSWHYVSSAVRQAAKD